MIRSMIRAASAPLYAFAVVALVACSGGPEGPERLNGAGGPGGADTPSPNGNAPRRGDGFEGAPTGIRFLAEGSPVPGAAPDEGFAYAIEPRTFRFPADHGSHPEFRTEWWYFTGNVENAEGEPFGFEFTIFRYALAPGGAPEPSSAWSAREAWMAHLAVTDAARDAFAAEERLSRGAVGLAGATSGPTHIWVENWSITQTGPDPLPQFAIAAEGDRIGLDLELQAEKPPVLHGDEGVDPKGPEPGNASYYYSLTRLAASGEITLDGRTHSVSGQAWMDREWSTSALSPDVEGWDWFALQLSDGSDLMLYRLRGHDGSTRPFSGGSLVDASGRREALGPNDFRLEARERWVSPHSGAEYPVSWRITTTRPEPLELIVEPYLEEQEITLSVRYWEGAVRVLGTAAGEPVTGRGYVELAGY